MTEKRCSAANNAYFAQPCAGPLWVCQHYFIDGTNDYRCEKHAKAGLAANPFGPQYTPEKRRKQ